MGRFGLDFSFEQPPPCRTFRFVVCVILCFWCVIQNCITVNSAIRQNEFCAFTIKCIYLIVLCFTIEISCTNLLTNKISVFPGRTAIEAAVGNNRNIAGRYLVLVADQIAFFSAAVLKYAIFHFVDFPGDYTAIPIQFDAG